MSGVEVGWSTGVGEQIVDLPVGPFMAKIVVVSGMSACCAHHFGVRRPPFVFAFHGPRWARIDGRTVSVVALGLIKYGGLAQILVLAPRAS